MRSAPAHLVEGPGVELHPAELLLEPVDLALVGLLLPLQVVLFLPQLGVLTTGPVLDLRGEEHHTHVNTVHTTGPVLDLRRGGGETSHTCQHYAHHGSGPRSEAGGGGGGHTARVSCAHNIQLTPHTFFFLNTPPPMNR